MSETLKQIQLEQDLKTRQLIFQMFKDNDTISTSLIQRKCAVGYYSASRVLENLIYDGLVEKSGNIHGMYKFV